MKLNLWNPLRYSHRLLLYTFTSLFASGVVFFHSYANIWNWFALQVMCRLSQLHSYKHCLQTESLNFSNFSSPFRHSISINSTEYSFMNGLNLNNYQSQQDWMSQLAFNICQKLKISSLITTKNELPRKIKVKQVKGKGFHLPCPLYRLLWDGVVQFKDESFNLNWYVFKVDLPHLND